LKRKDRDTPESWAMACPHIKPEYPGGAESPSSPAWHEFPLLKGIGREYRQLSSTSAQIIQLMQLDVPSALSRRRPGSTFAVGTGFRRCSGFDMSDDASLPDESCE
jgi:hypothetical protein